MSEHGTMSSYVAGCRCEACTKANRDYSRNRYSAKLNDERGEMVCNTCRRFAQLLDDGTGRCERSHRLTMFNDYCSKWESRNWEHD